MHDIRAIREDPAAFDAGLQKRGLGPQAAGLLQLDEATVQALEKHAGERIDALGDQGQLGG